MISKDLREVENREKRRITDEALVLTLTLTLTLTLILILIIGRPMM